MLRCIGRRYPQAEVDRLSGCLERPPPVRFQVKTTGLVAEWSQYGDVWIDVDRDPLQVNPGQAWDRAWRWKRTLVPGKVIDVYTRLVGGVWRLEVEWRQGLPGGSVPRRLYRETFAAGFPKWQATIDTVILDVSPGWIWSGGNVCNVRPATYNLLPPNFCLPS